jgi:hypothetical protein
MNSSQAIVEDEFIKNAVGLLSQQLWCWGRDILRPEGNWLLETGFIRIAPPLEHEDCPSIYTLRLPGERCVVLQGFGVFYGKSQRGGIFLPRYEFQPRYTTQSTLRVPCWTSKDLSRLQAPLESQQSSCMFLTLELIDWIRLYELNVWEQLGVEYRKSTLNEWDDGERLVVPAEEMPRMWRWLGTAFAGSFQESAEAHTGQKLA